MKLLGIETSSAAGSVALLVDGKIDERAIASAREQTELLLDHTAELLGGAGLELASLDGVAFGRGPGSFTGLRVAAAVAQGFAMSSGVRLFPVSSLAAIAQGAWRTHGIVHSLVCIDARMGEVYSGAFRIADGLAVATRAEGIGPPGDVAALAGEAWTAIGDGFAAYVTELGPVRAAAASVLTDFHARARDLFPQAAADAVAGRATAVDAALPVYLREPSAWRR